MVGDGMKTFFWHLCIAYIIIALAVCSMLIFRLWTPQEEQEPEQPEEPAPEAETLVYMEQTDKPEVVKLVCKETYIQETEEPEEEPVPEIDLADWELLAIAIYVEAGGDDCSDETRMMVGNVILNRVADSRYPDTIYDVLVEPRQYNTFSWTGVNWPERADKQEEALAVERAYTCARKLLEGERVLPEDVIFQAEFAQGTETVAYADGMYFCR